MNKAELVSKMAEKSELELTKKQIEDALNAFMGSVEEALVNGEKVQLVGFGTFETRERAARQGRNPRDPQQVINIPASKAPVFKAGKVLKEANVNLDEIQPTLNFTIHIVNNLGEKFAYNMKLNIDLTGIYDGYSFKGKNTSGTEYNFFKEINNQ